MSGNSPYPAASSLRPGPRVGRLPRLVALLLAAAVSLAAAPAPGASEALPGNMSPVLVARFSQTEEDRVFADLPLDPPVGKAPYRALRLTGLSVSNPGALRAVTFHLRSGSDSWWSVQVSPSDLRDTLRIPFASFAPEGSPEPVGRADLLRISLWRAGGIPSDTSLFLESASFVSSADICVLRPTPATAPADVSFGLQQASRVERILTRAGIPFDTVPDTGFTTDFPVPKLVIVPWCPSPTPALLSALRRATRNRCRLVLFYAASPDLAELLDLPPARWKTSSSGWRSMLWENQRVPHFTQNLFVPSGSLPESARVLATWIDASGKPTRLPAVVQTPKGALFTHVPPLAFPAAQDLFAELAGVRRPHNAPGKTVKIPEGLSTVAVWTQSPLGKETLPAPVNTVYSWLRDTPAEAPAGHHIWLPVLNAVDRPDAKWLDPASPETRAAVRRRVLAALAHKPAGIHLDYLRSPDTSPASAETAAAITGILREIADTVRVAPGDVTVSVAVYPTPAAAALRNQDWPAWIQDGLVDYVVPMIYEDSPDAFRSSLGQCLASAPANRIVAGIGTGADESQVAPDELQKEIDIAADSKLRGVAFFLLDDAVRSYLSPR